jgi:hypothetical protein
LILTASLRALTIISTRPAQLKNNGSVITSTPERERAMAIFEGPDANRNIIIIVAVVVVVAIIYYLYTTGRLPGL